MGTRGLSDACVRTTRDGTRHGHTTSVVLNVGRGAKHPYSSKMLALSLLLLATQALGGHVIQRQKTCTVHPSGNFTDDSPAIVEAFSLCGQGGRVRFLRGLQVYGDPRNNSVDRISERDLLDRGMSALTRYGPTQKRDFPESHEYDWAE